MRDCKAQGGSGAGGALGAGAAIFANQGVNLTVSNVTFAGHNAACSGLLNIDFSDAPDQYSAATDGLILIRYLPGMTGGALTRGASGTNPRRNSALINDYFADNRHRLDVDGDGQVLPESDGIMIAWRLFGFSGAALTANAKRGTRTDQQVQDAIDALRP